VAAIQLEIAEFEDCAGQRRVPLRGKYTSPLYGEEGISRFLNGLQVHLIFTSLYPLSIALSTARMVSSAAAGKSGRQGEMT